MIFSEADLKVFREAIAQNVAPRNLTAKGCPEAGPRTGQSPVNGNLTAKGCPEAEPRTGQSPVNGNLTAKGCPEAEPRTENIEFEIRFGQFVSEKGQIRFQPGVDRRTFNRLRTMLNPFKPVYVESRDEYYPNDNGRFTNGKHLTKTKSNSWNIQSYGLRVGIAVEITDDKPRPAGPPTLIREKKRWSGTILGNYRLDLTEVTISGSGVIYEVELEALDPIQISGDILNRILISTLQEVQGSPLLYTIDERDRVITDFNRNSGSTVGSDHIDHRVLDQVRNLKLRDMVAGGLVPKPGTTRFMRYGVSIKPDGKKKYLFIHSTGIYLIYAPKEISKFLPATVAEEIRGYHGTILQGELMPKESILDLELKKKNVYMLLYDCLSSGNLSVRKEKFEIRQTYIDPVIKVFSKLPSVVFEKKLFRKFTTPSAFYRAVSETLNGTYPYRTDGLIFQPIDHSYDSQVQLIPLKDRVLTQHPDILKWKPPEELSIDLEISRSANGLQLLANHRETQQRVPFKGSSNNPFNPNVDLEVNDLLSSALNGAILEFAWNSETQKLKAIRDRSEKPHPNNTDITLDVWEDIHLPIDELTLRGERFSLVYRYHNRLKADLYSRISPVKTVLSIGTGKGGDISKWARSGVSHVLAVEPNEENRNELVRRFGYFKIANRIVPTVGQDFSTIYRNLQEFLNAQVDVLEYMLSLSFFFDNDTSLASILQLAHYTVRPGGYLIAFTIDGRRVTEYFNNPANRDTDLRGKMKGITFNLQVENGEFPIPPITAETIPSTKYKVHIDIPGSIVKEQTEYLVNIPRLTAALGQYGWKLITEIPANTETFMTESEYIFSSLFTSLVYQKPS